jgi:hypothetical protein
VTGNSRYDHLKPAMRDALIQADAARVWLTRPDGDIDLQGVYDLLQADWLLLTYEIAQARVAAARLTGEVEVQLGRRVQTLEAEVLALLQAAGAPPADAPSDATPPPCGVGWPPQRVAGTGAGRDARGAGA